MYRVEKMGFGNKKHIIFLHDKKGGLYIMSKFCKNCGKEVIGNFVKNVERKWMGIQM